MEFNNPHERRRSEEVLAENFDEFDSVVRDILPRLHRLLTSTDLFLATFDTGNEAYDSVQFIKENLQLPLDCEVLAVGTACIAVEYDSFVLRFPRADEEAYEEIVESRINTIPNESNAIPGVETLVAASYATGVVVSRFVEGRPPLNLTPEEKTHISPDDLSTAYDAIVELHARGLCLDNESNCLVSLDAASGSRITIIDPMVNPPGNDSHTIMSDYALLCRALT